MEKAKGAREPGTNRGTTRSCGDTASPTLAELGITKAQSSLWQKLGARQTRMPPWHAARPA
jgi:hypothetical protein